MADSTTVSTLENIHNGLLLYWRSLASARGMQLYQGDIEYVMSAARDGVERIFNVQLSPADLDRRLDEISAGMKCGALPDSIVITPCARPADLPELLARKGFQIDTSGLCMALNLDAHFGPAPVPAPPIQVLPVDSPDLLRQWVEITNTAFFGAQVLSFEQFSDLYALDSTRFFLAFYGGVPVCGCMTLHAGETATLEFVSTLADYRRKGLGAAVCAAALQDLRQRGLHTVTLRAEPDGIGIYSRLGFVEICKRVVATVSR